MLLTLSSLLLAQIVSGGGSGGGSSSATNLEPVAYASIPAAGTEGRVQYFTDAPYVARDNGSTWDYWLQPYGKVTPPPSGWSWNNQGSATIDLSKGYAQLLIPKGAGEVIRMRYRSAPSLPYSIIALTSIDGQLLSPTFIRGGSICLRQSSNDRQILFGHGYSDNQYLAAYFSNASTPAASLLAELVDGHRLSYNWYKVTVDVTNITYYKSSNGITWTQLHQHAVGTYFTATPDNIGYCGSSGQTTYDLMQNVYHWSVE